MGSRPTARTSSPGCGGASRWATGRRRSRNQGLPRAWHREVRQRRARQRVVQHQVAHVRGQHVPPTTHTSGSQNTQNALANCCCMTRRARESGRALDYVSTRRGRQTYLKLGPATKRRYSVCTASRRPPTRGPSSGGTSAVLPSCCCRKPSRLKRGTCRRCFRTPMSMHGQHAQTCSGGSCMPLGCCAA